MGELAAWFQSIMAAAGIVQAALVGWAALQCLWSPFLVVLIFRASLWLWDWLSLREAENFLAWHAEHPKTKNWMKDTGAEPAQASALLLSTVARSQRDKWRIILTVVYLIGAGGVVVVGLALSQETEVAIAGAVLLGLVTIGTVLYALA